LGNSLTVAMGDADGGSPIPSVSPQSIALEVLEAYHTVNGVQVSGDLLYSSDYPNQSYVAMSNIGVGFLSGSMGSWSTGTSSDILYGEHVVVPNSGEVDLWFKTLPPSFTYTTPDSYQTGQAMSLAPVNTGSAATACSISPQLPTGLTFNTTNGVISGTPTVVSGATNYTVNASNAWGSSPPFTINISTYAPSSYPITFEIESSKAAATNFTLTVLNGSADTWVSGPETVTGLNPITNLTGYGISATSTVVMQVTSGLMPTNALLSGAGAAITGTISGNTVTFSNVNLSAAKSIVIFLDPNLK